MILSASESDNLCFSRTSSETRKREREVCGAILLANVLSSHYNFNVGFAPGRNIGVISTELENGKQQV
ncbi:hypothetical protein H6P81_012705 [Aristolochia fimbriata]|uniref:Uncharacterized protein n=1 Tax=Aristolochia fimbriata TaxID=158543 RepID=A0AAV7EG76_ARIFI|nr:hypothetical protein H6P81_012705 [Aristolochia fimbriata]